MDIQTLTDTELLFGYKNVALYYENRLTKVKDGFNRRRLNSYLELMQIELSSTGSCDSNNNFRKNPVSFFKYDKHHDLSQIVSLFKHLRNSFAHGNVEKVMIGNRPYYCFVDIYTMGKKKDKFSMMGQIPAKAFKGFIQELKENQKKLL